MNTKRKYRLYPKKIKKNQLNKEKKNKPDDGKADKKLPQPFWTF